MDWLVGKSGLFVCNCHVAFFYQIIDHCSIKYEIVMNLQIAAAVVSFQSDNCKITPKFRNKNHTNNQLNSHMSLMKLLRMQMWQVFS